MKYRQRHIHPKIKNLRHRKSVFLQLWFWITLGAAILILGLLYLFFFYSKFQIQEIVISGNQNVQTQELQTIAWNSATKEVINLGALKATSKSIFMLNSKKLEAQILEAHPEIESVVADKDLLKGILVKIIERAPVGIFCSLVCFQIDSNGVVFNEITDVPTEHFLVTTPDASETVAGDKPVDKDVLAAVLKIKNELRVNFEVGVKEVSAGNPLIIETSEGWKIYFNPAEDIQMQIAKMNILLKDEISEARRKNLQYIYLHYSDRVYYK